MPFYSLCTKYVHTTPLHGCEGTCVLAISVILLVASVFFFFWWGLLHGPQQGPDRMKEKNL